MAGKSFLSNMMESESGCKVPVGQPRSRGDRLPQLLQVVLGRVLLAEQVYLGAGMK